VGPIVRVLSLLNSFLPTPFLICWEVLMSGHYMESERGSMALRPGGYDPDPFSGSSTAVCWEGHKVEGRLINTTTQQQAFGFGLAPGQFSTSCPGVCNLVCLLFARAVPQPAKLC
jgi:hypothetical protein